MSASHTVSLYSGQLAFTDRSWVLIYFLSHSTEASTAPCCFPHNVKVNNSCPTLGLSREGLECGDFGFLRGTWGTFWRERIAAPAAQLLLTRREVRRDYLSSPGWRRCRQPQGLTPLCQTWLTWHNIVKLASCHRNYEDTQVSRCAQLTLPLPGVGFISAISWLSSSSSAQTGFPACPSSPSL